MDKRRGGCAPNIAYTLALLGERPRLMATAGPGLRRLPPLARGRRRRHLARPGDRRQVHRLVLLQHRRRRQPDRLLLHRRDGQRRRTVVPHRSARGVAIISPNDPGAMLQYAEECRTLGIPYIWDPGQQCARMSGDELRDGLVGCDDRHLQRLRIRADSAEDRSGRAGILAHTQALVVTRGEHGCSILETSGRVDVAAVPPHRIVDPTGVGDAFRGGFLKGMARGASYLTCARLGSVAAAYALEHLGGQSHAYTWAEFSARYEGAVRGGAAAYVTRSALPRDRRQAFAPLRAVGAPGRPQPPDAEHRLHDAPERREPVLRLVLVTRSRRPGRSCARAAVPAPVPNPRPTRSSAAAPASSPSTSACSTAPAGGS